MSRRAAKEISIAIVDLAPNQVFAPGSRTANPDFASRHFALVNITFFRRGNAVF